ncbi:MAG: thioredoxin [Solirubrobacteraceae bacterium]
MSLETITDDQFAAEVLESERPVLVDFWAAWCPPCRKMDPLLAEIAAERDDLRIVKLDVESEQRTGARYGVLAMPTLMLFSGGREVLRLVGARPRQRLLSELDAALTPA